MTNDTYCDPSKADFFYSHEMDHKLLQFSISILFANSRVNITDYECLAQADLIYSLCSESSFRIAQ